MKTLGHSFTGHSHHEQGDPELATGHELNLARQTLRLPPRCDRARSLPAFIAGVIVLGLGSSVTHAQCTAQWLPGTQLDGVSGNNPYVHALAAWDPDGAGPQESRLVLGGAFTFAGVTGTNRIASWTGTGWTAFGIGMNNTVFTVLGKANGDLVAGGAFTTAGGVTANRIARWNGSAWSAMGTGMNASVTELAEMPNGDIIAGGTFTDAGGVPVNRLARWDGAVWSPMGAGPNGNVGELLVLPNGDLLVGGGFTIIDGVAANGIARWDGTQWHSFGTGVSNYVSSIEVMSNGDIIAAGTFVSAGGEVVNNIARWDGLAWNSLSTGTAGFFVGSIFDMSLLANGDLAICGEFSEPALRAARWDGAKWSGLGDGLLGTARAITTLSDGQTFVGGDFPQSNGPLGGSLNFLARLNNTNNWYPVGNGFDDYISALARLSDGTLVAGGQFAIAGGQEAPRLAKFDGSAWSAFMPPPPLSHLPVLAVEAMSDSEFVIGGVNVYRWDGQAWQQLGDYFQGPVLALDSAPDGTIVAGGNFSVFTGTETLTRVARWDGKAWHALGTGVNDYVHAVAIMPNGDIIAGGDFLTAGGSPAAYIARWNGTAWVPMGNGMNGIVHALKVLPNGDLIAGGEFTIAGSVAASRIARWNGTAWSQVGGGVNNTVFAIESLNDGTLVIGGSFTTASGGLTVPRLARLNVNFWSPYGTGPSNSVYAIAEMANGDLSIGGLFSAAGGISSAYFARWSQPTVPSILTQPVDDSTCAGGSATFTVTATSSIAATYRWQIEAMPIGSDIWTDLFDGAIQGSAALASNTGTSSLAISNADAASAVRYRCRVTNACGNVTTSAATLSLAGCLGDVVCDGTVNVQDLLAVIGAWGACGDPNDCPADLAPIGPPMGDDVVNVQDLLAVIGAWGACP